MNLTDVATEGAKKLLREGRIFRVHARPLSGRRFELFVITNIEVPQEWFSEFSIGLTPSNDLGVKVDYRVLVGVRRGDVGVSYVLEIMPRGIYNLFLAYRHLEIFFGGYSSNVTLVHFSCGELGVELRNSLN
jgi:hypothetical protein